MTAKESVICKNSAVFWAFPMINFMAGITGGFSTVTAHGCSNVTKRV